MLASSRLAFACVLALWAGSASLVTSNDSSPWSWATQRSSEVERESSPPVESKWSAMLKVFRNNDNDKLDEGSQYALQFQSQKDAFDCTNPSGALFDQFAKKFNRTFVDSTDMLERLNLFNNTIKRVILLNTVIQNEISNVTNYKLKPSIRNFHPISASNLWYADVTDCELGLIKYLVFKIFQMLERNQYEQALEFVKENAEYLPLYSQDGFEQLVNILIVRLFDRFKGDEKMDQLFQWPIYFKQISAYLYNSKQRARKNHEAKLQLVSYAYPSFFKDIKYNPNAINRTGDNLIAYVEHDKFNAKLERKFKNRAERNKRLEVFRQRATLYNVLNDESKSEKSATPEWVQLQPSHNPRAEKLMRHSEADASSQAATLVPMYSPKSTTFSDLTDTEFVAYLTNDYTLLASNSDSAAYLDRNFPVRHLSEELKDDIATELVWRRYINLNSLESNKQTNIAQVKQIASEAVDELISDVGLPIGSNFEPDIPDATIDEMFDKVSKFFLKPYSSYIIATNKAKLMRAEEPLRIHESELFDERRKRLEMFKNNYAIFKAWFVKEGWQLDEQETIAMLRLADMSWQEIKLTLFKVCCLTDSQLAKLSARNATINYMSSNSYLCQPLVEEKEDSRDGKLLNTDTNLSALEIYYYFSVHFNKHHSVMKDFYNKLDIFRRNIDSIRKYSCQRSLTLYPSLSQNKLDTLNTIDNLDPRRSYMDDLNLDRFEYFNIALFQALYDETSPPFLNNKLKAAPYENDKDLDRDTISLSRAGISYRREEQAFVNLMRRHPQDTSRHLRSKTTPGYGPTALGLDSLKSMDAYAASNVHKVYELVMQRYKYCMKSVKGVDMDRTEMKQQCQSNGPLSDQAANTQSNWNANLYNAASLKIQQQDQCAFYRMGLEPWSEGLIHQDSMSVQMISMARC